MSSLAGIGEFVRASVELRNGATEEKARKKEALARSKVRLEAILELFAQRSPDRAALCIDDGDGSLYVRERVTKGFRKINEDDIREAAATVSAADGDDDAKMQAAILDALRLRTSTQKKSVVMGKAPAKAESRPSGR